MGKIITLEERIKQAREVHSDKYDYSLITEYKNDREKYPIICPEHGVFYKSFNKHIHSKQGCPKCSNRFRYTTNDFVKEVTNLEHCKSYSFEKTVYKNNKEKIIVTCHEKDKNGIEHGDFYITPSHLLSGEGCPICRYIKSANSKRRTISEVIEQAKEVHGNKYDYSLITEYKNDRQKYPIICPEHGVFYQTMNNHIKGKQGCPKCGRVIVTNKIKFTTKEWVSIAKEIHSDTYDYSKVDYKDGNTKVCIICPKHGEFWQDPSNHIHLKQGCPKCGNVISNQEKEIVKYLQSILTKNTVIKENVKNIINNGEIDILIPEYNIGIEFDGLYWHSEIYRNKYYHLNKTLECEKKGIRLIHVFEDEWIYKQDIIKSMFNNIFGITKNKIYGRKCNIKEVTSHDASIFLEKNHLQGKCGSSVKLGLYYNNELVSLMTFGKSRHFIGNGKPQWELLRFCNKLNTNVIGGASKLLNYFINQYQPQEIVSYADRRWSQGSLYKTLGFSKYNESKPNYYYIINRKREYRFNLRKSILIKKYGCPKNVSEHKFCLSQKWYRIYDCGCLCYIWKNKK
jgi:predicted  nucleic acid-binding Zn-ribbon protein